jgi:hypothetical protein
MEPNTANDAHLTGTRLSPLAGNMSATLLAMQRQWNEAVVVR